MERGNFRGIWKFSLLGRKGHRKYWKTPDLAISHVEGGILLRYIREKTGVKLSDLKCIGIKHRFWQINRIPAVNEWLSCKFNNISSHSNKYSFSYANCVRIYVSRKSILQKERADASDSDWFRYGLIQLQLGNICLQLMHFTLIRFVFYVLLFPFIAKIG